MEKYVILFLMLFTLQLCNAATFEEADQEIGRQAYAAAVNRFAGKNGAGKAHFFLSLSMRLLPGNEDVETLRKDLKAKKEIKAVKTDIEEKDLLEKIIKRAGELREDKYKKDKKAELLSAIYYSLAGEFIPNDENVMAFRLQRQGEGLEYKYNKLIWQPFPRDNKGPEKQEKGYEYPKNLNFNLPRGMLNKYSRKVIKARKGKGLSEIIASPDAHEGTEDFQKIQKKIKMGTRIRIESFKGAGEDLELREQRSIIIEGDGFYSGWYGIRIEDCKNVVIRNLKGHVYISLRNSDATIVDSSLQNLNCSDSSVVLFNSTAGYISTWGENSEIYARNCNFTRLGFASLKKGCFENCIIDGTSDLERRNPKPDSISKECFRFTKYFEGKVELKNCIIYTDEVLGRVTSGGLGRSKAYGGELQTLRSMRKMLKAKSCKMKEPLYKDRENFNFALEDKSPGKSTFSGKRDIGAHFDEYGLPVPIQKDGK